MRTKIAIKIFIMSLVAALCFRTASGTAESLSYVDESGNIHFVDSAADIPDRYRYQLLKPTPTIFAHRSYKQELQEYQRKQAEIKRIEVARQREREKELKEKQKEKEREIRRKDHSKSSSSKSGSKSSAGGEGGVNLEGTTR